MAFSHVLFGALYVIHNNTFHRTLVFFSEYRFRCTRYFCAFTCTVTQIDVLYIAGDQYNTTFYTYIYISVCVCVYVCVYLRTYILQFTTSTLFQQHPPWTARYEMSNSYRDVGLLSAVLIAVRNRSTEIIHRKLRMEYFKEGFTKS